MSSPVSSMHGYGPSSAERNNSIHGPTVLVEGKLLSGDALLEFAQQKGLCTKCVQHVTHKRARKRLGMLRYTSEWVPLTITDDQEGNYTVYKGYCLQPTCWTLQEVQVMLGERPMIRSTSNGKMRRKATPTRTRDPAEGDRPLSRDRDGSRSPGSLPRGRDGSRSPGSLPRHPVADLVGHREGGGSGRARRRSSVAHGGRTPSTRNLEASCRPADRHAVSTRNLAANSSHSLPSSLPINAPLTLDHRRQNQQRQASDPILQQSQPQRQLKPSGSMDADRPKLVRKAVPDVDILQQLSRLHLDRTTSSRGLAGASNAALWMSLHKRHGDESFAVETRNGKVAVLLQLLEHIEDTACIEPSWALLSFITKQEVDEANNDDGLVRKILALTSCEFDRDDSGIHSKKLAALTLFNMLKAEVHSFESQVVRALQSMSSSRREHWIAVLLDTLMFQDEEQEEQAGNSDSGTTEILYVVWNLLLLQPVAEEEHNDASVDGLLLKTIVGIAVSILCSERCVYGGGSNEDGQDGSRSSFHLSETALGLLATVAARGGAIALAERQHECLTIVCETMERHVQPQVVLQGTHAIRHILTSYNRCHKRGAGVTDECNEEHAKPSVQFGEQVVQFVMMLLSYHEGHAAPELSAAVCRLLAVIFELDDEMIQSAADMELAMGPMVVKSLVRMLESASDCALAESASDILITFLNKDFTTSSHLRQTQDIAPKLIHWMERYHASPLVQENLCFIVEHLVSLEDHAFGQEIGTAGGLKVIGDMLRLPAQEISLIEAASRVLIGVLTGIDRELLHAHQVSLTDAIVSAMDNNERVVEIQLAGLGILHCLFLRADCLANHLAMSIPVVVTSMENHLGSVNVLTRSCSVIRMVANMTDDWGVFVATGAVRMIINAMLVHPESTEFVMEGMATLKDLAGNESFREHFDPSDAEAAVVSLFEANMANPEVLALAFATLNNVAVDSRSRTVAPMQKVVLYTIISALQKFPTDESILQTVCLLLKSFSYNDANLEDMRLNSGTLIPLLISSSDSFNGETSERARYIMGKLFDRHNGLVERTPRGL
jgi:hypothetical protein